MSPARLLAPRYWAYHVVAIVLVGIAVGLGLWQYDAWEQRRADEARDVTTVEPTPLADVMGPDDPFPGDSVGRPVVLEGRWVPGRTLYVSGRQQDDAEGYWAVTPLAIGGPDAPALMVVRGWAPDLDSVPAAPRGHAEFVAWLQPPEGTGEVDEDPEDDVLPQLRIADALRYVDRDLYGAYAVVADRVAEGDWPHDETAVNDGTQGLEHAALDQLPKVSRFTALRNLFYAIEWWVFALFAAFIWWRWARDELQREEERVEVAT